MTTEQSKWTKRIVKIIWISFIAGISSFFLLILLISIGVVGYIPPFDELENPKTNLASELISSDGKVIGKYYIENRTIANFEEISPNLLNALIATEDARFYNHSGIDFQALSRVFFKSLVLQQDAGGGSTLSQQLAKNLYRMRERTNVAQSPKLIKPIKMLITKLQEWVTAVKLERNYTKNEILVMYLNTVAFGHNAYGINSASQIFFGKTPDKLNIEEAAILVGLLKAPTKYSPVLNPDNATRRRKTVISQIQKYQHKLKKLTGWQIKPDSYFDSLRSLPLKLNYQIQTHNEGIATYFREFLRTYISATKPEKKNYPQWNIQQYPIDSIRWIKDPLYGWCNKNKKPNGENYNIYLDGLKIYTTVNSVMQVYAENSVVEHLGKGKDALQYLFESQFKYMKHPPFSSQLTEKEVKEILYTSMKRTDRWISMRREGVSEKEIEKTFFKPVRMTIFSWKGYIDTTMTPMDSIIYTKKFLRAGFVSIEPQTGFVRAYVGGIDYNFFKYDHVSVALRQVGSTFKPFVYTLALMPGGYSPCSKVLNIPYSIDTWNNGKKIAWTPKFSPSDYDDQNITLKLALALSLNQISAWIIKQYGPEALLNLVRKMGIESPLDAVYALCVGAGEVKLLEMVSAYCTYANQGVHVSPIFVTKIEDKYGNVLATFTPTKEQVVDESTAFKVIDLMRGVCQFGTGARLRYKYSFTADIAGKTGTTNDNSDGWFIGITPNLVSGAWVGGEERSIRFLNGVYGQGASMALPIWALYMQKVFANPALPYKQSQSFKIPDKLNGNYDCSQSEDVNVNVDNLIEF